MTAGGLFGCKAVGGSSTCVARGNAQAETATKTEGNPNVLLFATLDGRQIPLGDLGMRHYLRAPGSLSEHVEVPIVLRDLPVGDGFRHRVHIFKVSGYGERLDTAFVSPVRPVEGWPITKEIAGFNIGP